MFQLLVFLLADALSLLAAAGAGFFRFAQVMFDGQTRQMIGKFLAAVLGTIGRFGLPSGIRRRKLNPGHEQPEEQQLPGIEAFGAGRSCFAAAPPAGGAAIDCPGSRAGSIRHAGQSFYRDRRATA